MTIKEFIRNSLTEKGKPYTALLNNSVSFEIGFWNREISAKLKILDLQLEERFSDFKLVDSLDIFELVEVESLYDGSHWPRKTDYTIKSVSEEVLIDSSFTPLFVLSQTNRIHKFVSQIENGKLILEFVAELDSGKRYTKGKLLTKE